MGILKGVVTYPDLGGAALFGDVCSKVLLATLLTSTSWVVGLSTAVIHCSGYIRSKKWLFNFFFLNSQGCVQNWVRKWNRGNGAFSEKQVFQAGARSGERNKGKGVVPAPEMSCKCNREPLGNLHVVLEAQYKKVMQISSSNTVTAMPYIFIHKLPWLKANG